MKLFFNINYKTVYGEELLLNVVDEATDGSEKQATISVHVPTFSVSQKEYTVTSKKGMNIPISINGSQRLNITYNSPYFTAYLS